MNKEELSKVPFRMVSHMAMEGEHYSLYANYDYGFKMQKTVKIKKDGFTSGKTYTDYYFNGKWYNSLDKFLEAIKLVRPIKPTEVTESGCKIIDIRLKTDKNNKP